MSAGNSSYSTSTIFNPYYQNQDIQTVGSPGLASEAITVASSVNGAATVAGRELVTTINGTPFADAVTKIYLDGSGSLGAFETLGATSFPLAYPTHPTDIGKNYYTDTDTDTNYIPEQGCNPKDWNGVNLAGKVALIKRGSCTFQIKTDIAADAGAVGVVVWNQNPDPDITSMALSANTAIPSVMIMNSFGSSLFTAAKAGSALTAAFNGVFGKKEIADPNKDTMSSFSSWGTTPNLKLKPDLTAPGSNIYSSIVNNQYASFNGTSMSSPHVAGAAALLKQAHPAYTPADVKAALMNTAKVLSPLGSANPYSPRQQGAGRIQVDKAIDTQVLVTGADGYPSLSLGQFNPQAVTPFTLRLTNNGAASQTFTLTGSVFAPGVTDDIFNSLEEIPLSGAGVSFSQSSVLVPANGQVTVNGTLDLSTAIAPVAATNGYFAEGYITLTSSDGAQPNLSLPFMGYAGAWSGPQAPPIIDPIGDDEWSYTGNTGLTYPGFAGFYSMGFDADNHYSRANFAINNNPSDYGTLQKSAYPILTLLRNAKSMSIEVRNSENVLVDRIANEDNLRNMAAAPYYLGYWNWDGMKYNPTTGLRAPVPEGSYNLVFHSLVDGSNDPQNYLMPVTVDNTAPTFTSLTTFPAASTVPGPFTFQWNNVQDPGPASSGMWGAFFVLDGNVVDWTANVAVDHSIDIPLGAHTDLFMCLMDNAGNMDCSGTLSPFVAGEIGPVGPTHLLKNNARITLPFQISQNVKAVSYHVGDTPEIPVDPATGQVALNLGSHDGTFTVTIDAYSDLGATTLAGEIVYTIELDATPPMVMVSNPVPGRSVLNTRVIDVTGDVSDAHLKSGSSVYSLDGGSTWVPIPLAVNGSFAFTATYQTDGRKNMMFRTEDTFGNKVELSRVFIVDTAGPVITTSLDKPNSGSSDLTVSVSHPGSFVLSGTTSDATTDYSFSVNGLSMFSAHQPAAASPKDWMTDDAFAVGGAEPVVVQLSAGDEAGNTTNRKVTFQATQTPLVRVNPGVWFANEQMTVAGTIARSVTSVKVNGSQATLDGNGGFLVTVPQTDTITAIAFTSTNAVGLDFAQPTSVVSLLNSVTLNPQSIWSPNLVNKLSVKYDLASAAQVHIELWSLQPQILGSLQQATIVGTLCSNCSGAKGLHTFSWNGNVKGLRVHDGQYEIRVVQGLTFLAKSIVIDTKAPNTPVVNTPTSPTNQSTITITGSATGAERVVVSATGPGNPVSQTAVPGEDGNFTFTFSVRSDGTYSFTVTAYDQVGNSVSALPVRVIRKTTTPTTPWFVVAPSKFVKGDVLVQVQVKAVGSTFVTLRQTNGTAIANQTVTLDRNSKATLSIPAGALADGTYTFSITGTDAAGNSSSALAYSFVVDNTLPTLTFTSPPIDHGKAGMSYSFSFTVTEANLDKVSLKYSGVSQTLVRASNGTYTVTRTLSRTVGSTNTFDIALVDKAGNMTTVQVLVTSTSN
jgi:hypothetical protein